MHRYESFDLTKNYFIVFQSDNTGYIFIVDGGNGGLDIHH